MLTISFDLEDDCAITEAKARGWDGTGNPEVFIAEHIKTYAELRHKRKQYEAATNLAISTAVEKINADPAFEGVTKQFVTDPLSAPTP